MTLNKNIHIPIIFVHTGNPFYLKYTLRQARYFNKSSDIYLIGDKTNNIYNFIKHVYIEDYSQNALEFEKVYNHMSTNPYWFELICFQRWFIIYDFCKKNDIQEFVYLDSDALIFSNVSEVFPKYRRYKFTVKNQIGPPFCFFQLENLNEFCSYLMTMYTDEELSSRIKNIWINYKALNHPGGICDMTGFQQFQVDNPGCAFELSTIDNEGCFCLMDKGENQFISDGLGFIKIFYKKNMPYGKLKIDQRLIHIRGLEFGGNEKNKIPKYYAADGYIVKKRYELFTFWLIRIKRKLFKIKFIRNFKDKIKETLTK